ncbi:MAG TPA: hypothetical protein VH482_08490 [Thermomicrobiales bacterium]|jgi:hypothetical protein
MIGRSCASRDSSSTTRHSKSLLLLAVFCLLMLPQSYMGGASLPHPHAIFQFWFHGSHLTAAHHHDDGDDDHDHTVTEPLSPAEAEAAARAAFAETPTIAQMPPSYEGSDAIGSILVDGLVFVLAAMVGLFAVTRLRDGLTPSPEAPPPRLRVAST